jgi:hypothetical protein
VPLNVAVLDCPDEPRLRPVGTAPLVVNVQAPPFGTVSTCEYGVPTEPAGNEEGLKLKPELPVATLTEYACEPDPFEQPALIVKANVPDEVGVPISNAVLRIPVELRLRPGGRVPLEVNVQVVPLTAVIICE